VVAGAGATGRIIAGIALIALSFGIASLAAGAAAGSLQALHCKPLLLALRLD
jgi:hypothetical protein